MKWSVLMSMLNWLDYVFIAIVLIFSVWGFAQGFLRGLFSLVIWLVALVIAYFFADVVTTHYTSRWFDSIDVAFWIAFFAIIIIVWLVGHLIRLIFSIFKKSTQSLTDRCLGFIFGFVKSTLVLSMVVGVLSFNPVIQKQTSWEDSLLVPWLVKGAVWAKNRMPEGLPQKVQTGSASQSKSLNKSAEELRAIG